MGTTTFSGPIKAGTIKDTTGTTVGTNVANVGQVVMAQTFTSGTISGATTQTETDVVIPANSQIINIITNVVVVITGSAAIFMIGNAADESAYAQSLSCNIGTVGVKYLAGVETQAWANTGNEDLRVTFTQSQAAPTGGEVRFTILYQQNANIVAA